MGRNFYIIIQGSVSILLKKKGLEENPDEKFATSHDEDHERKNEIAFEKKKTGNLLRKILNYENTNDPLLQKEIYDIPDEDFLDVRFPSFFKMRLMTNGESFGEIALRQNVPRLFFF